MTDDVGFGASSTFGGPVPTPTLDALAAQRPEVQSNSTRPPLFADPRGADHRARQHTAHTGIIMERSLGYPGYDSLMPKSAGTIGEILRGTATTRLGSARITTCPAGSRAPPARSTCGRPASASTISTASSAATPTNGTRPCSRTRAGRAEGALTGAARANYNLDADLADQRSIVLSSSIRSRPTSRSSSTMRRARRTRRISAEDWIAKFKGQFDQGWDRLREETFERQKKLGVIPEDTILTPRPANMPAWDSLNAGHKELFAHMAEIYAAFLAYDDANIGRVIDARERSRLARQHAHHLHRGRQRQQRRGNAARDRQRNRHDRQRRDGEFRLSLFDQRRSRRTAVL